MVELKDLIGKKVKVTRSNGTFVIGILRAVNTTHIIVFDDDLNRETAEPIALVSYREAW